MKTHKEINADMDRMSAQVASIYLALAIEECLHKCPTCGKATADWSRGGVAYRSCKYAYENGMGEECGTHTVAVPATAKRLLDGGWMRRYSDNPWRNAWSRAAK